jgi:hypothetical protein
MGNKRYHSSIASPCCRAIPRGFQLRIQNSGPGLLKAKHLNTKAGIIFYFWFFTNFNNRVNWTSLLTKAAINALCHIDVVSGGPATSVRSLLGFDGNGLYRKTQFLNAALMKKNITLGIK